MDLNNKEGRKTSLNIISSKVNHKGFGSGALDLSNLSSVIIDGDQAYIDQGAIHGKSKIERGVRFSMNRDEVPNGRKCWVVWVAVGHREDGAYYAGVTACEMSIDSEARRGWKILADHVNRMDDALKRRFVLDDLNDAEKQTLRKVLIDHNSEWWERSDAALKERLNS